MSAVPDALERSNNKPLAETHTKPAVSVVTVIDFSYQGDRVGDNIKATMAALAAQDFDGPLEFIVPETADRVALLPPEPRAFCRLLGYCHAVPPLRMSS
jgi:hypothetical protein